LWPKRGEGKKSVSEIFLKMRFVLVFSRPLTFMNSANIYIYAFIADVLSNATYNRGAYTLKKYCVVLTQLWVKYGQTQPMD